MLEIGLSFIIPLVIVFGLFLDFNKDIETTIKGLAITVISGGILYLLFVLLPLVLLILSIPILLFGLVLLKVVMKKQNRK